MINIIDKKEFFKKMLKDRSPIVGASFCLGGGRSGELRFYSTPLGAVLLLNTNCKAVLNEIKMYDKSGGNFEIQNVFCGENLIKTGEGTYIGVSSKLQIEDVVDRSFLIKTEDEGIIVRARMIPKRERNIDKESILVYN